MSEMMSSNNSLQIAEQYDNERRQLSQRILFEVKKRPLLWRKVDPSYKNRLARHHAWEEIGRTIGVKPFTAKLRWRYLRDIFQKELKRIQKQSEQGGDIKNLKLWMYFKNMMFLKEEYMDPNQYPALELEELEPEPDQPESLDVIKNIKIENDESNDSSIEHLQDEYLQELNVFAKSIKTDQVPREMSNSTDPQTLQDTVTVNVFDILDTPQVVKDSAISLAESSSTAKKRKMDRAPDDRIHNEYNVDEDMLFVKSLVPYFKDLDPVRKLRLKSRIQSLIADELERY